MTKIESYQQLKDAKLRSKLRLLELEDQIKNDYEEIKNDFKPINFISKTVKSMLTSEKNGIVSASIGGTVNVLVKNLLFRKSNFITKALVGFVAKNYANNLVTKNSDIILDWVQIGLQKLKTKHHEKGHHYDSTTVDADLE